MSLRLGRVPLVEVDHCPSVLADLWISKLTPFGKGDEARERRELLLGSWFSRTSVAVISNESLSRARLRVARRSGIFVPATDLGRAHVHPAAEVSNEGVHGAEAINRVGFIP